MSCCAPCSADAVKKLRAEGRDFIVLFYNPNIFPRAEYDRRLAEQIRLCEKYGAKFAVGEYEPEAWLQCVKGLEREPERGARCEKCFLMRLKWGAKWAAEHGYDSITSVFGVSPHKNQAQVDAAAETAIKSCRAPRAAYENPGFGYAPEPDMYRQKYCGCAPALAGMAKGGGDGE